MKSEKFTFDHARRGSMSTYRQTVVGQFEQCGPALDACKVANGHGTERHYVLNDAGQEYYDGVWID